MDSHLESKFLGVEKSYIDKYQEKVSMMAYEVQNMDDYKTHVNESFVVEKDILLGYIQDLITYIDKGVALQNEGASVNILTDEDAFNIKSRVVFIISKYQEQPELLDPILGKFLSPMVKYIQLYVREKVDFALIPYKIPICLKNLFDIIYNTSKVRGMKTVVKLFPHDVEDLEKLVNFVINLEVNTNDWYLHYVLFLWLSMVVIVPFDLETVIGKSIQSMDTNIEGGSNIDSDDSLLSKNN